MHHRFLRSTFLFLLGPDHGAPSGGGGAASKTIEEQLSEARTSLAAELGKITGLTTERDTARSELTQVKTQFDELTKTATASKTELDRVSGELTKTVGELTQARTSLNTAQGNITRLETLCGVKGIAPDASVPSVPENQGGPAGHIYDQWLNCSDLTAKQVLYSANKAAIRAEHQRRMASAKA